MEKKTWLLKNPILCITGSFPPRPGGTSTIIKNLTDAFEAGSFVIVSYGLNSEHFSSYTNHPVFTLPLIQTSQRHIQLVYKRMKLKTYVRMMGDIIQTYKPMMILGVFPDVFTLRTALETAKTYNCRFSAYLHDTVLETCPAPYLKKFVKETQHLVFRDARPLFVMSEGMASLYREKYRIESLPLVHSYPEPIPEAPIRTEGNATLFWSGNVYNINHRSFARMVHVFQDISPYRIIIASKQNKFGFKDIEIPTERLEFTYFPHTRRKEYLEFIRNQGFLLLALNWPDESPIHPDELRTIFPTKTPEYLASGRPIIVHCPEDYFLAQFFRKHRCGFVISTRDIQEIRKQVNLFIHDRDLQNDVQEQAIRASRQFQIDRVVKTFLDALHM